MGLGNTQLTNISWARVPDMYSHMCAFLIFSVLAHFSYELFQAILVSRHRPCVSVFNVVLRPPPSEPLSSPLLAVNLSAGGWKKAYS